MRIRTGESSPEPSSAHSEEKPAGERRRRYQPVAIYAMAESLRRRGVDLATRSGPWHTAARALGRAGRNGLAVIPIVTNGLSQVMVDTMEHAAEVAGLLNWCGVHDLDPVPDLVPPARLATA